MSAHPLERLDAHAAGVLDATTAAGVEAHVLECAACREELALVREGREAMTSLGLPELPADLWARVERQALPPRQRAARWAMAGVVAAAIVLAVFAAWSRGARTLIVDGELHASDGGAIVGVLDQGEIVQTGDAPARLRLGRLGHADLGPHTRVVRLGFMPLCIGLQRGTLRAVITAPPRRFIVETPHARAIDLGCAYEIVIGDDGGSLRVDTGLVELQRGERSVIVPGGFSCAIVAGLGPGVPVSKGAAPAFRDAADLAVRRGRVPLEAELALAGRQDALTLLELLELMPPSGRAPVRQRLQSLVPAPATVTSRSVEPLRPPERAAWREAIAASP